VSQVLNPKQPNDQSVHATARTTQEHEKETPYVTTKKDLKFLLCPLFDCERMYSEMICKTLWLVQHGSVDTRAPQIQAIVDARTMLGLLLSVVSLLVSLDTSSMRAHAKLHPRP
jgi:hypothetical protein